MSEALERRIAAYAAGRLPDASDVRVTDLARIAGGASRETFRFLLSYSEAGNRIERRLILRRDMPSSLLESERRIEFGAFRAVRGTGIPVPEMLWLEEDGAALDLPFFIAEEIGGYEADTNLLQTEPYLPHRAALGRDKWRLMGKLASLDPGPLGYHALFDPPAPEDVWRIQLDYWEGVLDEDAIRPEPLARAAIRWMRRNPPPPPARVAIVHGDFRTGNFLYDRAGAVRAVLDWEMTHLGDPLEDLGWSLSKLWHFAKDELSGGLLPREEAIAAWEEGSGMRVDRAALHWWDLLAAIKGQGLWVSSGRNAIDGPTREMIHFSSAWFTMNSQDRSILELMGH